MLQQASRVHKQHEDFVVVTSVSVRAVLITKCGAVPEAK